MKKKLLPLLLAGLLLTSSCGRLAGYEKPEDGVLIYAALNPVSARVQSYIDTFNKTHEDVRIEIRDYSDEGGSQRLRLELAAGLVPDIMELHQVGKSGEHSPFGGDPVGADFEEEGFWLSYRNLAQRGYLEDLWPYIETDPELGREGVVEEPLKAAEVDGGLYILFREFFITTLIGLESVVGDRCGWTFEELMETFSVMPPGSTILRYDATKWDVFSKLLCFTLDKFIDWEEGNSSFDCEEFRNMLEFLNTFPTEFKADCSPEKITEESAWRILEGEQLLQPRNIFQLYFITYIDMDFAGRAAFVGYPTADGSSGSFFCPYGPKLAMSASCKNKEAAWDFMRQLIQKSYSSGAMKKAHNDNTVFFPVNRADYELGNRIDLASKKGDMLRWHSPDSVSQIEVDVPSEDDLQRLEALINSTTQIYWPDDKLSDIVWDTIGAYFAGDRSLDATVKLIDNRVRMYIWERK